MSDFLNNIKTIFNFNKKSIDEKNKLLNEGVENLSNEKVKINGNEVINKVDKSNIISIDKIKKNNIGNITLATGEVKSVSDMFDNLIKPSKTQYIADPNSKNESKFITLGKLSTELNLTKEGLNIIIDGATRYIDTKEHYKMVDSINNLYKNYIEYDKIIPKSNLLSINRLNNEIGLLEEKEKNIIMNLNKAYNDYYKKEGVIEKSLIKIEDLVATRVELYGTKEDDEKLIQNLNKIKELKDNISNNKDNLKNISKDLTKEDIKKEKQNLNVKINKDYKDLTDLLTLIPNDIKKALNNYDANVLAYKNSLKDLEKAQATSIEHNNLISSKIEEIKKINKLPDTDDYSKSGVLPKVENEEKLKEFKLAYENEYKGEVEQRANLVKVYSIGIPGLSESQYLEYKKAIGFFESRHEIDSKNPYGFLGRYQVGVQALQDAGIIKPKSIEKFLEKKNGGKMYDGWQNDFLETQQSAWDLKKCPGGLKGFLKNSDLQDSVMDKYTYNNYLSLSQKLIDQGKSINDVTPAELPGLLASAHLIGPGGVSSTIRTQADVTDANKTPASVYREIMTDLVVKNAPDGKELLEMSEKITKAKLQETHLKLSSNNENTNVYQDIITKINIEQFGNKLPLLNNDNNIKNLNM